MVKILIETLFILNAQNITSLLNKPLIVAVLDTGISKEAQLKIPICKDGIYNLTTVPLHQDSDHGTNVSGLIHQNAKNVKYCQIIIKVFGGNTDPVANTMKAVNIAIERKAQIINYSAGGYVPDAQEFLIFKKALDKGIKVVAAAGNDSVNLGKFCSYYPACYDNRIIVIGNKNNKTSNFGKPVTHYIDGTDKCAFDICLTGTSQATAVFSGKLLMLFPSSRKPASSDREALEVVGKAFLIKSGAQKTIDSKTEELKEQLPKPLKAYGKYLFFSIDTLTKGKVEFKYEF